MSQNKKSARSQASQNSENSHNPAAQNSKSGSNQTQNPNTKSCK